MEEYVTRVWEQLIGRVHGPLTLCLLLQPTVVAILAILDAMKDARDGRPVFQLLHSTFQNVRPPVV
jgi:hypothetical protein